MAIPKGGKEATEDAFFIISFGGRIKHIFI
jgi:hypothetical protein